MWFGGYPAWRPITVAVTEFEVDPQLGWRNRQGQYDLYAGDTEKPRVFHYTNWSGGRRATSTEEPKSGIWTPTPTFFFGDSYIQGFGLSDADTLPWIVQKRHPELTVTNLGTSYYGTYQSFLSMKKTVDRPANVFYSFNDFHEGRNIADRNWVRIMKPPPPGFFFPYADMPDGKLEDFRAQGSVVWPWSFRLRSIALVEDYYDIARTFARTRRERPVTEALLVKMNEWVTARGGRFTVILFDSSKENRQVYRDFLASKGVPFVDADHPELGDRSLRLPDGHPSGALNARLAGWLDEAQAFDGSRKLSAGVQGK